jgi:AcrR family transcriptional regulator
MARPTTISDDDILEAARAVFAEKGAHATTAEVAARAGVSEGTLFKRFGNKAQLFRAAMSTSHEIDDVLDMLLGIGPLETLQDFERLVELFIEKLRLVVPVVLMGWAQRKTEDGLPEELRTERPAPLRALLATTKLLERQMEAGTLQKRNAEVVARILIGSVWHYCFMEAALEKRNTDLRAETFVKELARLLHFDLVKPADHQSPHKKKDKGKRR